jgi:hypothetical protein
MWWLIKEMLKVFIIVLTIGYFSFNVGRLYEKKRFYTDLWVQCEKLKGVQKIRRLDEIWLIHKSAFDKKVAPDEYCIIKKFE